MISVVLCVRNGEEHIGAQLESLALQDFDGTWELVVVDDRSTDRTAEIVGSWDERLPVRLVHVRDGNGLANARNVGIEEATGDLVLFCDADDVAAPGWLSAMAAAGARSTVLGGHLEERLLNRGGIVDWRYPLTDGALPGAFGRWRTPVGANMGFSTALLRELGGFDPALSTGEEVDLAIRAQLAGHTPVYVPDAVMHYRHRDSLRHLAKQAYSYGRGNADLYRRYRSGAIETGVSRQLVGAIGRVLRGAPRAALDRSKRGAWVRYAAYTAGQVTRGVQLRALWIG